jgi:hypothetical protein
MSYRWQVFYEVIPNDPKPVPLVEFVGALVCYIGIKDQDFTGLIAGIALYPIGQSLANPYTSVTGINHDVVYVEVAPTPKASSSPEASDPDTVVLP